MRWHTCQSLILGQSLHSEVLDPLYNLLSIALELPEDYIRNLHKYEVKSEVSDGLSAMESTTDE